MNVASRWACLVLALAGCGKPAEPPAPPPAVTPPPAPPTVAATPASATSREILVDLARWDAATTADRRAAAEDVARRVPDFALLRLETFSCGGQTHEVAIYRHAKTEMEFVLVPGGTFVMGSSKPEGNPVACGPHPSHVVTLTRPFLIARTDVTQLVWKRMTGGNRSTTKGDELPVQDVSWIDAEAFCVNLGLELPTEAQWESACRAGTTTSWFFGEDEHSFAEYGWTMELVRSGGTREPIGPKPVGRKRPNALGLFDMSGNVSQWCRDAFGDYPAGSVSDPLRPARESDDRVLRGGDWGLALSSARRSSKATSARDGATGFRPAKTVPMD